MSVGNIPRNEYFCGALPCRLRSFHNSEGGVLHRKPVRNDSLTRESVARYQGTNNTKAVERDEKRSMAAMGDFAKMTSNYLFGRIVFQLIGHGICSVLTP
jgi:hypothetical protein